MQLSKLIRIQNKKASSSLVYKGALTFLIFISCLSFALEAVTLIASEYTTVNSAARMWSLLGLNGNSAFKNIYGVFLMFGLPIFAVLPFSDEILRSKNSHIAQAIFTRVNRKKYYLATTLVAVMKSFAAVFLSLGLNQILWLVCCPFYSNAPLTQFVDTDFEGAYLLLFEDVFFNSPYLHNFLYILLISVLAGGFAFLSVTLCFVFKKQIQIFVIPVIIYLAQSFIMAAVGLYNYSIAETISPMPAVRDKTIITYIIFLSCLLIVSFTLYFYGTTLKKDEFE